MNLNIVLSLVVVSVLAYRFRFHLQYAAHHLSYQPEWQIRRSLSRQIQAGAHWRHAEYLIQCCLRRVGFRNGSLDQQPKSYMEIAIDGPVLMVWFNEFVAPGVSRMPRLKKIFEIDLAGNGFRVVPRHAGIFRRRKAAEKLQKLENFRVALNEALGDFPAYFALTGEYLPEIVDQPWLTTRAQVDQFGSSFCVA